MFLVVILRCVRVRLPFAFLIEVLECVQLDTDKFELIEKLVGKQNTALVVIDCNHEAKFFACSELTKHLLPFDALKHTNIHRVEEYDAGRDILGLFCVLKLKHSSLDVLDYFSCVAEAFMRIFFLWLVLSCYLNTVPKKLP